MPVLFSEYDKEDICRRMVLVCGTSTCHMAVSRNKLFTPRVWGPYWSGTHKLASVWLVRVSLRVS